MNGGILSIHDFGDLQQYNSMAPFDFLALAAYIALEKEKNLSSSLLPLPLSISASAFNHNFNPKPNQQTLNPDSEQIKIPMPGKRAVPIDLNEPPEMGSLTKRARTTVGIPRKSPINFSVDYLPPAPVHAQNPSELPVEFRHRILELGGSEPKMVFEKKLYSTDVNVNHGRLTIPLRQCTLELKQTEVAASVKRDGRGKNIVGFEVMVIEPGLKERTMRFKDWATVASYALVGGWNDLVKKNGIKKDDILQLWSFRRGPGAQLSFALVKLN